MSSACMCHVEGAFCFYCEVYSPVVAENERLEAEVAVIDFRVRCEMTERLWELAQENEHLYDIIADMQATMKPMDHCDSCAHLRVELAQHKAVRESYLAENAWFRGALERISGASMSVFSTMADMAGFMKRTATEVLRNGSTQESGE